MLQGEGGRSVRWPITGLTFLSIERFAVSDEYQLPGSTPLRIPRLCGVIESGNDSVSGILLTNITPNPEIPRLSLIDINTVALYRRKKWASQIEDIVEKLHDIGVVWGNAKADNILIDRNNDTWIINFGGGWTEHWVDPDLADSVKGDLQGLKGILYFLGVQKA